MWRWRSERQSNWTMKDSTCTCGRHPRSARSVGSTTRCCRRRCELIRSIWQTPSFTSSPTIRFMLPGAPTSTNRSRILSARADRPGSFAVAGPPGPPTKPMRSGVTKSSWPVSGRLFTRPSTRRSRRIRTIETHGSAPATRSTEPHGRRLFTNWDRGSAPSGRTCWSDFVSTTARCSRTGSI